MKRLIVLLGAVGVSASAILVRWSTAPSLVLVLYRSAIASLILTPYVLLTGGISLGSMSSIGWVCLLIVGLVHTGITYCLYFTALKDIPGQEAAILSYIDPLVAVVIGVLVLGEPLSWQQLIGGGLILGFTLWNEL